MFVFPFADTPPVISQAFKESLLNPGDSISLRCVSSGNPVPTITWSVDTIHVTSDHRVTVSEYLDVSGDIISVLNVTNVRQEDGGLYACHSQNRKGTVQMAATVNLYGKIHNKIISLTLG